METTQIGSYHLADNPELYDPQRDNNFEFIVMDIDNILRVGAKPGDQNAVIPNAQHTLRFSVVSSSIPMFTQQVIEIRRGNSIFKTAGAPKFDDGTLVVNDYIGADTKSALMAWQNLSYNVETEKVGDAKDYKKTCYLVEYTPNFEMVRTWRMVGCFVSGLKENDFTMDNTNKKTITATISFDRAYMELSGMEE